MYNKINLINNGVAFSVTFDGKDYDVPIGEFEAEETLGNFIKYQADKWKISVSIAGRPQAPTVSKINQAKIVAKDKHEEQVTEETNKVKTSKKIEDLSKNLGL